MYYIHNNLNVYYEKLGRGKEIILLHGWAANNNIYKKIVDRLVSKYSVYLIDLPGFGKSIDLDKEYTLDDYVLFLKKFIETLKIDNPILIGHSFGGRIAIRYSIENKVDKIVLIDSAGIKRVSIKNKYKIYKYKLKKKYYILTKNIAKLEKLQNDSGSIDYRNASNIMKKTLINVVNENQKNELKEISVEVLLLWGKLDKSTPHKDGLLMNKLIKNSGLVTFTNSGHFPFIDEEPFFLKVISSFLNIGDNI